MNNTFRIYPIGIQNFEQLRTRNCVYVDKTELVYKLVNTDQIYFFSRPRRFGKSLLVSTLEAYFQGKKELFEGLAMERLEQEWEVCPVLHVDFSLTKYTELRDLTGNLRKKGRGRGGGRASARHHPACLRQDRKAGCSAD